MLARSVAACVVVAAVMMSGVRASAARPGLSWCSESTLDNFRITKDQKPELGLIGVVVNNNYEENVVDEVFIRQQLPCEGITQEEVVHLDGERAELILRDGEISLFWGPPDTMPIFQEVDDFCITASRDSQGSWGTFLAKFCFPIASLQVQKDLQSCSEITCVRKCCPPQMALSRESFCATVEDGKSWHPNLTSDAPGDAATPVHMLYGPPRHCDKALRYDEFSILPSGMVQMDQLFENVDGYCIDTMQDTSQEIALVRNKTPRGCRATRWCCCL